jgi:hypothetical protein
MRKTIRQFPLFMALLVGTPVFVLSLIFVTAIGVLVGLFVELFKAHSRISNLELKKYKIAKPIEKDILVLKPTKVFKLPLPEKMRSKGVFLTPISEEKLSEAR